MNSAAAGDVINIEVTGNIQLANPLPAINSNQTGLTINGSGNTTISGYGAAQGSIFTINKGVTAEIDNVWIVSGTAQNGGGIYNSGTLTLKNDYIEHNTAEEDGGGIYNTASGSIYMQNDITSENNATQNGGGIYNENLGYIQSNDVGSDLTNFFSNTAGQLGGAIYNNGTMVLYGDNIVYNQSKNIGGGVNNNASGSFTLYGGTIEYNVASGYGGGIRNSGILDLEDGTLIEDNTALQGGGLMLDAGSSTTLNMVTVSGNSATGQFGVVAKGIGYHQTAVMHFTGVTDNDDPGGNPVQC